METKTDERESAEEKKERDELNTHIVVSTVEQRVDGFDKVMDVICLLKHA